MRGFYAAAAAAIILTVSGCASRTAPPTTSPGAGTPRNVPGAQNGLASYYAQSFQGRTTASGVAFDNNAMVAAHPSLPFGSLVRITNLVNQRTVTLEIVDRGPAESVRVRGVIIDISRAAAQQLDFIRAGRTRVRVEVLRRGAAQ
jgi:rare lipoprotein A